jgi:hypothetical protein
MPTRKQAFRDIIQQLEKEFHSVFPGKPTTETQSRVDRVRRSLTWLARAAELSEEDTPPRFVDLWIGLNALYGQPRYATNLKPRERDHFTEYIQRLAEFPSGPSNLFQLIKHFHAQARNLIKNKHLWNEWWDKQPDKYRERSDRRLVQFEKAFRSRDTIALFVCVFERLQILRNQIIHGSSSASTRTSQDTLYPAILFLEQILPEFIRLMIREGQGTDWPPVPYPGKGSPGYPEQSSQARDL